MIEINSHMRNHLTGILDNCANASRENPVLAAAIFVGICKSNEGAVTLEALESMYHESLKKVYPEGIPV